MLYVCIVIKKVKDMKTIKEGNFTATFPEDFKPKKPYNGIRRFGKRELNSRALRIQKHYVALLGGDDTITDEVVRGLRFEAETGQKSYVDQCVMAAFDILPSNIQRKIYDNVFNR